VPITVLKAVSDNAQDDAITDWRAAVAACSVVLRDEIRSATASDVGAPSAFAEVRNVRAMNVSLRAPRRSPLLQVVKSAVATLAAWLLAAWLIGVRRPSSRRSLPC
jgi:hypothetical protein